MLKNIFIIEKISSVEQFKQQIKNQTAYKSIKKNTSEKILLKKLVANL